MPRVTLAALAAACFGAAALARPAAAQDLTSICEHAGHPPEGAWSEFRITGGRNDGATLRVSDVGSESRAGKDYFWFEVVTHGMMNGPRGDQNVTMITKELVPGIGPEWGPPQAVVVKYADAPAMEMPSSQGRGAQAQATALQRCHEATVVGWESVTVPAGTFRALHIKGMHNNGDLWVAPDLPFAIVKGTKGEAAGGDELVLTGHGRGATSRITERPQPYNPMLLMMMMREGKGGH